MQVSNQTSNVLNGTKWQLLKNDTVTNARSMVSELAGVYGNILYTEKASKATMDIFNSLHNLGKNESLTNAQLCEWVELNKGHRIKNKKDFEYIVLTIANKA